MSGSLRSLGRIETIRTETCGQGADILCIGQDLLEHLANCRSRTLILARTCYRLHTQRHVLRIRIVRIRLTEELAQEEVRDGAHELQLLHILLGGSRVARQ